MKNQTEKALAGQNSEDQTPSDLLRLLDEMTQIGRTLFSPVHDSGAIPGRRDHDVLVEAVELVAALKGDAGCTSIEYEAQQIRERAEVEAEARRIQVRKRLEAAAPDLLRIAQMLKEWIDQDAPSINFGALMPSDPHEEETLACAVRAAMAKVEGAAQ